MDIQRLAAFADGETGGNPAGIVICNELPAAEDMQRIAHEVGYSETAFAAPQGSAWRVRYFSPESEVPFCGHATIALGAALAMRHGNGVYPLELNLASISVEGQHVDGQLSAALQSPPTRSAPAPDDLLDQALALFGYSRAALDTRIAPALANGGADHLLIMLNSREQLAAMHYDQEAGRKLMNDAGLVTILLGYAQTPQLIHSRNPFASGGVYEDPATGAATAALAGYLRDISWPHNGQIEIIQGEDMGMRSRITAQIPPTPGASIRVSGAVRTL
ncbi:MULTISPECIES: PhzF family phenazine biosynthesis protein [Pseudomonas]|uniref:PhzF family phenazine biosynthesis protein n=1 Tax=Pseudomonas TaxID=286 RepID=UPI000C0F0D85|nr:PhzF family phenazine biosynthesis protein [Pseudomonadaceae bacterium]HCP54703.1 PhzF family phenazine biosynthesis protein [Pseudomonas sp.]